MVRELKRVWPGEVEAGVWIEFEDANGLGVAQPDAILLGNQPVVVEVKHRETRWAKDELSQLYLPLVEEVFEEKFSCLSVFRVPSTNRVRETAFWRALDSGEWHFLN